MMINQNNYPTLWAAFDAIRVDGGDGGPCVNYEVPDRIQPILATVEEALKSLSGLDFETFVLGELFSIQEIAIRSPQLTVASDILDDFTNDWPERN